MGKKNAKKKKIKREREGKDPSRIRKFIKEKHSWSDSDSEAEEEL